MSYEEQIKLMRYSQANPFCEPFQTFEHFDFQLNGIMQFRYTLN